MIKMLGCMTVFSAAIYYLLLERKQYHLEQETLLMWFSALSRMESMIRWKNIPLVTLLEKEPLTASVSEMLKSKIPLQIAWQNNVAGFDDRQLVKILGDIDFSGDKEKLIREFHCAQEKLDTLQKERREGHQKTQKVRTSAILCSAAFLIILLI